MLSEHKGHHCQHRSDDFPVIAGILKPHKPGIVVELGTDRGGFAAFLADLVRPWGGQVHTFDIAPKFSPSLLTDFPNLRFVQADILGSGPLTGEVPSKTARHPEIVSLVAQPGAFLYCDNGHKQSEIELYASLLQIGSILGVHDYQTEVKAAWVEPFVAALGYEQEGHAKMEALRNEWYPEPMSRFWVRRRIVEPVRFWPGAEEEQKTATVAVAPSLPVDTSELDAGWFQSEQDDEPDEVPTLMARVRNRFRGGRR